VELGAFRTSVLGPKGEWSPDREGSEVESWVSSSITAEPIGDLIPLDPDPCSFLPSELPFPPPGGRRGVGGQSAPVLAKKKSKGSLEMYRFSFARNAGSVSHLTNRRPETMRVALIPASSKLNGDPELILAYAARHARLGKGEIRLLPT
jgi:hypothetical protein